MLEPTIVLSDFPEGYEKAKSLLAHIPEENRDAYLRAFIHMLMTM